MDEERESFWPMQRMTTRPILERLRESRTRHWIAFAASIGATILCFVVAGAMLPCDETHACSATANNVATVVSFLAFAGTLAALVILALAIRLHLLCQKALLRDVETPYH